MGTTVTIGPNSLVTPSTNVAGSDSYRTHTYMIICPIHLHSYCSNTPKDVLPRIVCRCDSCWFWCCFVDSFALVSGTVSFAAPLHSGLDQCRPRGHCLDKPTVSVRLTLIGLRATLSLCTCLLISSRWCNAPVLCPFNNANYSLAWSSLFI